LTHDFKPRVSFEFNGRKEYLELPFPTSEYEMRLKNTRQLMLENGVGALIVYGDQNDFGYLTYLANLELMIGRGAVIVMSDSVSLVTDSALHGEPMHTLVWKTWIEDVTVTPFSTAAFLSAVKSKLTGVDGKIGLVGSYSFPKIEVNGAFVDLERGFRLMKSCKSNRELKVMREASRITSCGMKAAVEVTRRGVRETDISAEACKVMFEEGASRLAFQPVVVSGRRAGMKHDFPTNRKIDKNEMIYIDIGATWKDYYSDMSRTVLVGNGTTEQRSALDSILEIHNELMDGICPGTSVGELARKGEALADKKGWRKDFWSVGHGLGTGFFEIPIFAPNSPDIFNAGMVFAYEPMIVKLGLGTAVVEDTVVVTKSGCKTITDCEKKLW